MVIEGSTIDHICAPCTVSTHTQSIKSLSYKIKASKFNRTFIEVAPNYSVSLKETNLQQLNPNNIIQLPRLTEDVIVITSKFTCHS